jgi:hypothetical protein
MKKVGSPAEAPALSCTALRPTIKIVIPVNVTCLKMYTCYKDIN